MLAGKTMCKGRLSRKAWHGLCLHKGGIGQRDMFHMDLFERDIRTSGAHVRTGRFSQAMLCNRIKESLDRIHLAWESIKKSAQEGLCQATCPDRTHASALV